MARTSVDSTYISKAPWSLAAGLGLGLGLFALGAFLPVALRGQLALMFTPRAWAPFSHPVWTADTWQWGVRALGEILPKNLLILFLAGLGLPYVVRRLAIELRNLPLIYAAAVAFVGGILSSPGGFYSGGGWYLLYTVPFAALEVTAYLIAATAGSRWAWGREFDLRLLWVALLLLIVAAVIEAGIIATLYEPYIGRTM